MRWLSTDSLKVDHLLFFTSFLILIITFLGIVSNISIIFMVIFLALIFLAFLVHFRGMKLNKWIINLLSIIFVILPFVNFSLEDIVIPSVEALALISAVRFLSQKTPREYFQIYLLALLLLSASTLFSFSWTFLLRFFLVFALSLFSVFLITYLKDTSQQYVDKFFLKSVFKYMLLIIAFCIPMSVIFFLFLPRTPYPLFSFGFTGSKTGFSSLVNLGDVSSIQEDRSVVMRVYIESIPQEALYWRIISFDNFNGKNWTRKEKISFPEYLTISGKRKTYSVLLEPSYENYLPLLDFPSKIYLQNVTLEYPAVYKTATPISQPLKYMADSYIEYEYYESAVSENYLQLPPNISDKTKKLVAEVTSKAKDDEEIINSIMEFLKNYEYSLKELPRGNNPIEDFIFNTKRGNCEYFASTMALMLRIKGIPARVVGGFKGGSYNPLGGYYVIRASDAHLWVEAWLNGFWKRYDPSSGRIVRYKESFVFNFLDYFWNKFIIAYDFKTQLHLISNLKSPPIPFKRKILFYVLLCFIGIIFTITFVIYQKNRTPLKKFLKLMEKAGYKRQQNKGLMEFVSEISDENLKNLAMNFIEIYMKIYFKDKDFDKIHIEKLNFLLRELNAHIKSRRSKNKGDN